jgi:hypothetical protein
MGRGISGNVVVYNREIGMGKRKYSGKKPYIIVARHTLLRCKET